MNAMSAPAKPKSPVLLICWLCCVIAAIINSPAADAQVTRNYSESEERGRFQELLDEYGQNKSLPPGFELQALLALSHYPELKTVSIRFVIDDVDIPLSSRPHWASLLKGAEKRNYLVVIDSNRKQGNGAFLLKNQPFNAQVGILGHELAHTVYYLDRSFFGIVADALCQLSDCRIQFERATDRRVIDYGLGWQRFDHALFVRSQLTGSREAGMNSEGGGGAYMSPSALLQLLENDPRYQNSRAVPEDQPVAQ